MTDDRLPTRALARLSPPPGGEQRLRAALLDREPAREGQRFGLNLPLAAAFACLCVLAVVLALRPAPMDSEIQDALHAAVTPPPGGIRVSGADVESVESLDPDVRIYRLATR